MDKRAYEEPCDETMSLVRKLAGDFLMEHNLRKKEIEMAFMNAMITYLYHSNLLTIEEANAIREDLGTGDILLDNITLKSD